MNFAEVKGDLLAHGQERIAASFICALAAISGCAFLFARLIPGVDLPNHLAVATIVRYAGDMGNSFRDYFHVEAFLRPCIFHPTFCSLPIWPSVEFANRLLLTAYAVALPLTTGLIIRRAGGSMWLGLLSLLLIHNFNMSWGFVGFTMAIPVVLTIVYQLLGHLTSPSVRRALTIGVLCLFLYTVHVLALLFALMLILAAGIAVFGVDWRRWRSLLLALLPSGLLIVWWWWQQPTYGQTTLHHLYGYYTQAFLKYLSLRPFELLTLDNYFLFPGTRGMIVAAVSAGVIVLAVLIALLRNRRQVRQQAHRPYGRVLLAYLFVSLMCFALLPHKIPGEPYIYQRFSVHVLLAVLLVAAYLIGRVTPVTIRLGALACATISVIFWVGYVRDFNSKSSGFTAHVFDDLDPNMPVTAMVFDDAFRGEPLYMQFPNYYITWRHGIVTTSVADYRFSLVRRRVTRDVLPIYNPVIGRFPSTFDPSCLDVPYILTRGPCPVSLRPEINQLRLVKRSGEWAIYASQ